METNQSANTEKLKQKVKKAKKRFQFKLFKTSLMTHFLTRTSLNILIVCAILSTVGFIVSYNAIRSATQEALLLSARQSAATVVERVNSIYQGLEVVRSNPIVQNARTDPQAAQVYLSSVSKTLGYSEFFVVDSSGKSITRKVEIDVSNKDYFKQALQGNNSISDPTVDLATLQFVITAAMPIQIGNDTQVLIAVIPGTVLSDIVHNIKYLQTGYAFMVNKEGVIIAHPDTDLVFSQTNHSKQLISDPTLAELVKMEEKMAAGETGWYDYTFTNTSTTEEGTSSSAANAPKILKTAAYVPVPGLNWSIAITAPYSEVYSALQSLLVVFIAISVAILIASLFLSFFMIRGIVNPLKSAIQISSRFAEGDFTTEIPGKMLSRGDELGLLSRSLQKMSFDLSRVLSSIHSASEQVANGSRSLADSSMSLSQGATEQASSIEELSATIEQVSSQTKLNADHSKNANIIAMTAKTSADHGNTQMREMLTAMKEINASSNNISKIIKVIDEIAFQTNMLALNAAVEAARVGQHGKGFAVVAEEVRNLAARSANAAKETSQLIETTVFKVGEGTKLANETSEALQLIVDEVGEVSNLINQIAIASDEQSLGIEQINQAILQVSSVVQANSTIAEECASSSEELSVHANSLKTQVNRFKLNASALSETVEDEQEPSDFFEEDESSFFSEETSEKSEGESKPVKEYADKY